MNNNNEQELTFEDYKKILDFYQMPIPRSRQAIKKAAEGIIGLKLCRCLKKLEPIHGARAIGECTSTVINRKGFARGAFRCTARNQSSIRLYKRKRPVQQTRRRVGMQTRSSRRR